MYVVFSSEDAHRQTEWRADEVIVTNDTLQGPKGVLATFDPETGAWIEPDGAEWSEWLLAPME